MHFLLWTKVSLENTNADIFKVFWWKFAKFLMSFSKPQVSFSSNFDSSVSWNMLLCTFLGQTLYTLHKRDWSKCKLFRLFSAQIKIHEILVIFETKNKFLFKFCTTLIVRIGVSTPPQKYHLLLSGQVPPYKSTSCPSPPLFRQSPPLYWFFVNPLKVGSFSEPPKY